jgi:hypothetical protein
MMTICSNFLNLEDWLYHCTLEAASATALLCTKESCQNLKQNHYKIEVSVRENYLIKCGRFLIGNFCLFFWI